jgi:hypothetical protein
MEGNEEIIMIEVCKRRKNRWDENRKVPSIEG